MMSGGAALIRLFVVAFFACAASLGAKGTEAQKPSPGSDASGSDPSGRAASRVPGKPANPDAYRLSSGDVLEFSVRGFPELRHKAMIELDGEVTLPLTGNVRVVGMSLAEAQSVIRQLAIPRPLQHRALDGRESYVALSADDVMVSIAEYRPIYVLGDVGKPGEVPFRPGMTVRQAIALGGGFDIMRYRLINPFTESADFKGQHEVLWTEAARARVRLSRIEAELEGKSELASDVVADIPLNQLYLDEILKTEIETLKRRQDDHAKEVAHMRGLIELNVAKVDTLRSQLDAEVKGSEVDTQELEQMKDAQRRGNLPLMRLMEIRRIQLTNATRVLQTRVQFDQAERDLAEARHALERLNNTRRTVLLGERQDQTAALNALEARISANAEKLIHTSLLKSRLVRGSGAKVKVAIHRTILGEQTTLVGSEGSPLLPGDTVEVMLENEHDVDDVLRRGSVSTGPELGKTSAAPPPVPSLFTGSRGGATQAASSASTPPTVRP